MKVLVFRDKTSVNFTDTSTIADCVAVFNSFAEVDNIAAKFTEENLIGATFDGVRLENILPVSVSAAEDGDKIVAHFTTKNKSQETILEEKLSEVQGAITDLAELVSELLNPEEEENEEEVDENEVL